MTEPSPKIPPGVGVLIIAPDGHVWAQEFDFEPNAPGGCSLKEGQTWRAQRRARRAAIEAGCNKVFAAAMDEYHIAQIFQKLHDKGWREQIINVGHPDE
jgi:hypothetical protein